MPSATPQASLVSRSWRTQSFIFSFAVSLATRELAFGYVRRDLHQRPDRRSGAALGDVPVRGTVVIGGAGGVPMRPPHPPPRELAPEQPRHAPAPPAGPRHPCPLPARRRESP